MSIDFSPAIEASVILGFTLFYVTMHGTGTAMMARRALLQRAHVREAVELKMRNVHWTQITGALAWACVRLPSVFYGEPRTAVALAFALESLCLALKIRDVLRLTSLVAALGVPRDSSSTRDVAAIAHAGIPLAAYHVSHVLSMATGIVGFSLLLSHGSDGSYGTDSAAMDASLFALLAVQHFSMLLIFCAHVAVARRLACGNTDNDTAYATPRYRLHEDSFSLVASFSLWTAARLYALFLHLVLGNRSRVVSLARDVLFIVLQIC